MFDELPRLKAEDELAQRAAQGSPSADYVYDLVRRATDNPDQADKAAAHYVLQQMRAGQPVS